LYFRFHMPRGRAGRLKRSSVQQRWRVARIRGSQNQDIGTVTALDAAAAIRKIVDHKVTDPVQQRRLVARPEPQ
jgi:hypothetical protein